MVDLVSVCIGGIIARHEVHHVVLVVGMLIVRDHLPWLADRIDRGGKFHLRRRSLISIIEAELLLTISAVFHHGSLVALEIQA